jgi:ABC-type lipoprotein release transport system permease subunit
VTTIAKLADSLGGAAAVGAGLLPAVRASRLSPVEALRGA